MLNNKTMNVVQTAKNGVVNHETLFHFSQKGNVVSAHYAGGFIKQGYLVGTLTDQKLRFSYCQIRTNGQMDHGTSECKLSSDKGKVTLEERFEMSSENGLVLGTNIFKEI